MYRTIVIDLETIPTDRQDVRDFIAKMVTPPGTIKLPASIEKWNAENKPAAIDEAVAKTGLDGTFGRVCCIGYAIDDSGEPASICGLDEAFVLTEFNSALNAIPVNQWSAVTVVGHNVSSFDLRFLVQRYIVNGIKPHAIIASAARAKPYETEKVFDTMVQWNPDRDKRTSLDKLCMALGIEGKGEFTWEDVYPAFKEGRLGDIATYCEHDVKITREVFRRMTFA